MSDTKEKLLQSDLYKLFDVEETSTIEEIKKAYRKKALALHPDKNLGNKEEAEIKFVELGKAFEILADKSARAAYDAVRKQRREKAKRDEQLDDKRRKLKEQLESREKAAKEKFEKQTTLLKKNKEEEHLQNEIERLRKEGSKLLEEEMNFINEQVRLEKKRGSSSKAEEPDKQLIEPTGRLKVSWSFKNDSSSIKIDHDLLSHLFSKYGELEAIVVSKKSNAIVEFKREKDALKCLNDQNKLKSLYSINLTWVGGDKPSKNPDQVSPEPKQEAQTENKTVEPQVNFDSFEDMEMAILKKLKAASGS